MRGMRTRASMLLIGGVLVLGLVALAWAIGTGSSEAQQGTMYNCPQAGKWAISVWSGDDATDTGEALAACGAAAVDAAYYIDPTTNSWQSYFLALPQISTLPTLDNMQGVITHGAAAPSTPTPTPTATPTPAPAAAATCNLSVKNGTRLSIWVEAGSHAVAVPACFGCSTVDPDVDSVLCGTGVPVGDLGALPKDEDVQVTIWSSDRSTVLASRTINIPTEADKAWLCVFELTDGSVRWNLGYTYAVPPPIPTAPA